MKKILSLWLLLSFFTLSGSSLKTLRNNTAEVISIMGKGKYSCLLCGFDNASSNTDTIIIATYDSLNNTITFVHIPRDTYYNFGSCQNKINQISPSIVSKEKSLNDGLATLSSNISNSLAVDIDGFTGFTDVAVANLVDIVGGVNINVPIDITGRDFDGNVIEIKQGKQLLSGREALVLLRHRSSYALGDLTRIDMQKLFLSAFVNDFFDNLDITRALKLLNTKDNGVVSNVNFVELLAFAMKNLGRIKNASVKFATIPGKAIVSSDGISYFLLNKISTVNLLSDLEISNKSDFDSNLRYLFSPDVTYQKIYYSTEIKYKIYSGEELNSLNFIQNDF